MGAERVGVLVPTYNRPDLARSCVLQLSAQSRAPDLICIHQNGHPDSYEWAVRDLRVHPELAWMHSPGKLPQHQWYARPLRFLLEQGCTHFFWADHDDLYLRHHVEAGLADLREAALLQDLEGDTQHQYADNVVEHVTMPRFRCHVSERVTCVYHAHEGSVTSAGWLEAAFSPPGSATS